MSRLSDLLRQVERSDPALAADLSAEVRRLSSRREFGLNFERHTPEAVELPGRPVRKGDKVRVLAPRGETGGDPGLWRVTSIDRAGGKVALLGEDSETTEALLEDVVVVAEFRDPIYPGLVSTGRVGRGGPGQPFHTVIDAENFHALEALRWTHEGKVDAIYIDPPYNTGARDWKYNNDYVDSDDIYRHSKWLAMMERRLKLAKKLLNPENSVLIVTIDEKEYLRLGLLLQQVFPEARIQMVSVQINPANVARQGAFGRSDEYAYVLMLGEAAPQRLVLGPDWVSARGRTFTGSVRWDLLRRSGTNARRADRPKLFYPLLIDPGLGAVVGTGVPLSGSDEPDDVTAIPGRVLLWPIRKDGSHGNWQLGPEALMKHLSEGRVRLGGSAEKGYVAYYLKGGEYAKVLRGDYPVLGRKPDGSLDLGSSDSVVNLAIPGTQWRVAAHDSTQYGSRLLAHLLPSRRFPFPKSLYAVEDTLRFFVADKPDAVVLDFFAGSGTTAHAVMRLNKQDGGRRQCISVTNNEVSAEEQKALHAEGLRPGEPEWEAQGICEFITKPRIESAITGRTPDGEPIKGDYKFTDEFPMSDGFEANAEFFTLTYQAPLSVQHNHAFSAVAPLLWLRAGATGSRIEEVAEDFSVADTYAVLFDLDHAREFVEAITTGSRTESRIRVAYVVTDDERGYQSVCAQLPEGVEPVRLYSSYLANFSFGGED